MAAIPAPSEPSWEEMMRREQQAEQKARDTNMTLTNNPLATVTPEQAAASDLFDTNMRRLREDACRRRNPAHGRVYSGIMGMRFGG